MELWSKTEENERESASEPPKYVNLSLFILICSFFDLLVIFVSLFLRIFIIYYCCYYVFCFYVCVSFLFFSMFFYLFSFLSFGRQLKKNLAGYPQEINLFNYVLIFFVMFNNFPFFLDCKYFCLFVTIWYYLFLFYFIMLLSLFFFSRLHYDPSCLDSLFS
jgi:hypothetical protein